MRDPERITHILQKLERYWVQHPDLRLGQLIENAKAMATRSEIDTFYVEDDVMERGLDALQGEAECQDRLSN